MTARKKKQPVERFPLSLSVKQRESLVHATRLTSGIKTKIKVASAKQQFVEFTQKELEKMAEEVRTSLRYAPPADKERLIAVLDKIDDLLDELNEDHPDEKPHAVPESGAIYQFKVTLKGSYPPIWRRIQVPDCTLGEFHNVLQAVMGWDDCHLHQFVVRGEYYGQPDPLDQQMDMEKHNEKEISISQVAKMRRKVQFTYEYDFGDSWEHDIVLEKTLEPDPKVEYPRCTEGQRACPPEDCGGVWGYQEFLEAIANPMHESHEESLQWVGGKFEPDKFDLNAVNRDLRRL